ncbi:hypothetical protein CHRYSEO8AT_40022 [Chryseobacterium sp. 8AT]|nr:hypothetical protein CHRYSEO8AT_40022 [Chryseobacterium sp. 8AT]
MTDCKKSENAIPLNLKSAFEMETFEEELKLSQAENDGAVVFTLLRVPMC